MQLVLIDVFILYHSTAWAGCKNTSRLLDYDSLAEPSAAFPPERSIMLALEVFERVICATAARKGSMFCIIVSAAHKQDI